MTDLVVGKTYDVAHARKGRFRMRLIMVDEVWVRGVIVSGRARYVTEEDRTELEEIDCRRTLCDFTEVKGV